MLRRIISAIVILVLLVGVALTLAGNRVLRRVTDSQARKMHGFGTEI